MNLGLIAYAENTGLGSQTKDYYDMLKPLKTMVLDRRLMPDARDFHPDRFPYSQVVDSLPGFDEVESFLNELDVVLMAETTPTQYLLKRARERGVKTVIVPNYEYWHYKKHPGWALPDFLMPATEWHFDDYPDPKCVVPYPISLKKVITDVHKPVDTVHNFVHVAGKPIYPDRNGTETVLKSLQYISTTIKVTIFCQKPAYIDEIMQKNDIKVPKNVDLLLRASVEKTSELYEDQHVLLLPRRFGGLCLPVNEAIGYGLPVIMPDINPNNTWLPKDWLIPAKKIGTRLMADVIDVYEADAEGLANLIDRMHDRSLYWFMRYQVSQLQQQYSWDTLRPKYIETLTAML